MDIKFTIYMGSDGSYYDCLLPTLDCMLNVNVKRGSTVLIDW